MWNFRGRERPSFADEPGPGQESVWDYPRPPALVADPRGVTVRVGDKTIAATTRAMRVLETASPPTFYLPAEDVDMRALVTAPGNSFCEWKGVATYWALATSPDLAAIGWSYPRPNSEFAGIAGWLSFYPGRVECYVGDERVRPQPGGFYGGWLTDEIVGPVKGEPGTGGW